jgi:hypothetical protein
MTTTTAADTVPRPETCPNGHSANTSGQCTNSTCLHRAGAF